ncbi:response regulator transcription factor [Paenibacillus sp. 453mf]|uniref:response regulator transcription factor n=1 Tax=Paenibacillus sp. 453mf TaxID=1761874 RepID=UPI0008E9EF83|nr:response regulator transcription factor [Paenibacillus sp. 453mf]SFS69643.1 two-component system, response regulator YesN [Paenibacillus sp. 453mf]
MKSICKVMIVDDEMLVRQGIKHLMNWEQAGFRIVGEAANGLEALDLVEEVKPHIILTDIVMPIMDGEKFVKIVKERHPRIEVIVLSSFSEFEYVRSTFQSGVADYILKPKLEADYLLSILNKTAAQIVELQETAVEEPAEERYIEQAAEKLIAGYEAELQPGMLDTVLPGDSYVLFGMDMKHIAMQEVRSSLIQTVETMISQVTDTVSIHLNMKDQALYLMNMDSGVWNSLIMEVRERIGQLPPEKKSGVHFVLTDRFTDFYQLGEVYQNQFLSLARYSFYLPDMHFIFGGDLPDLPQVAADLDMGELTEQLKRKQFQRGFAGFLEHIHLKSMDYRTDTFEFKAYLGNFIFNVTSTLGKMKYDTERLEQSKYEFFRRIDEARYARDAIQRIVDFIHEAEQVIGETNTAVNPNMAMLLSYIQEHFRESVTLTEVAKQFHFNPSYLSSYFSAHNNEGFSEYLNKIRVQKAMELLTSTEESISEISASVGYSDQSYFTKVFKKLTGLSPSTYRREQFAKEE